ncbi:glycosyl transferase family protein [Sphingomonas sp. JC676]|uniref:glycosyl transferase family protein n=1 Tax=Sphingomonas sp. JC676 TaxID=2768065 RepID=UPI001657C154|nr:glycosyl transferase family protein [Sphingomonas sp. JC676]MBC9034405.1 glycosyl transferase family protein [Sphingomonas sp. JC676]
MGDGGILVAIDAAAREATLFAAIFFLLGGIDDLLVDLIYAVRRIGVALRRLVLPRSEEQEIAAAPPIPIAIFVAAWDEAQVIGQMLRSALGRFDYPDYALYVGTYPNDPATIAEVARVAELDERVRLVIGSNPGPTTKADCLNALWRALRHDEAAEGRLVAAVVLHDAEDLVHPFELRVFADFLRRYGAVQLPVLPLRHPDSRFVSGHYLDEFAEAHSKTLLVRQALGAGLPLAGVGCAIRRDVLGRIAAARGGMPFDATSLVEDYELGLAFRAFGCDCVLARVPECPGGRPVAVRAYFPATLNAAVRQKARWMTGIALAGWDRTGWGRPGDLGDHWMRVRDRRATLAMPVLAIAYCALVLWGAGLAGHAVAGTVAASPSPLVQVLLWTNLALLGWRLTVRAAFVTRAHGWRDGLLSVPRILVANYIALLAARRAIAIYARLLAGSAPQWDKTDHQFPDAGQGAA